MNPNIAQLAAAQAELLRHLGDVVRRLWDARLLQTLQTDLGQDSSIITATIAQLQADEARLRGLLDHVNERMGQGTVH
jgi:hypothetical protein